VRGQLLGSLSKKKGGGKPDRLARRKKDGIQERGGQLRQVKVTPKNELKDRQPEEKSKNTTWKRLHKNNCFKEGKSQQQRGGGGPESSWTAGKESVQGKGDGGKKGVLVDPLRAAGNRGGGEGKT